MLANHVSFTVLSGYIDWNTGRDEVNFYENLLDDLYAKYRVSDI
jgi:hypothetical protein